MAYYRETMEFIMKNGFAKNFLAVAKYPFCFNKIKLILALLLPKFLLRKIKLEQLGYQRIIDIIKREN